MSFGRKKTGADETSETESSPGDNAQAIQDKDTPLANANGAPVSEEETGDVDTAEAKPGFWRRITARTKRLFARRSRANADDEPNEDTPVSEKKKPSAKEEIFEEGQSDAAPAKRRIPIKKLLFIGVPLLSIILIATVTTVLIVRSNTRHREAVALEEKHQNALAAEFKKLQDKNNALLEENKKLRSTPAHPDPINITQETTPKPGNNAPPDTPAPTANNSKPPTSIGDCAVSNKESAGESLKRCIDAYNAATGRQ